MTVREVHNKLDNLITFFVMCWVGIDLIFDFFAPDHLETIWSTLHDFMLVDTGFPQASLIFLSAFCMITTFKALEVLYNNPSKFSWVPWLCSTDTCSATDKKLMFINTNFVAFMVLIMVGLCVPAYVGPYLFAPMILTALVIVYVSFKNLVRRFKEGKE